MFYTRINRYIIREILSPTLLCIVIFTTVMVLGRAAKLVDLIISKGIALSDILILLATLLPSFLSISLPLAFLLGIMIGLGRMSADSEIVALKSSGIGLANIATPVFALAFVFALLTMVTSLWIKPWGDSAFATKSFEILRQKAVIGFQPRVFMSQFNNLMFYANEIDDRTDRMHGLFIVEKRAESTSWVFADSGEILSDEKSETVTIRLHDGVIHRQQAKSSDNYQLIYFRNYDILPEISAMNSPKARKNLKPKELPIGKLLNHIKEEKDPKRRQVLQGELQWRLSLPLAPFLFVLFGLPFSVQSHRSGRSGGFVVGLIIFLGYYFTISVADTLTRDAATPPWLTYWTANLLLGTIGAFLLRQSSLEKPNFLAAWIDQTLLALQKRVHKNVNS